MILCTATTETSVVELPVYTLLDNLTEMKACSVSDVIFVAKHSLRRTSSHASKTSLNYYLSDVAGKLAVQ